ncbi:TrkH family potassium uptake protein [Sphingobacterium sp. SGG-5]|uniref:TrkH family potassium uptake protein n=1 Tax=Sphingobacterium sp. SGG-5 TaxID=2710881 RepID=UPI0019D21BC0|nr:potassium transporter TrkG [Sphingobacterium sp. SGG-5]
MKAIAGFLKYIFRYRKEVVDRIMFYVSLICALTVIVHVGYITNPALAEHTDRAIHSMFYGLFVCELFRTLSSIFALNKIDVTHYSGLIVIFYFLLIGVVRLLDVHMLAFLTKEEWVYLGIALIFLSELSKRSLFFDNFYFNPTILFVISFIGLILIGTLLLMLPRTTLVAPLSFLDALFMATSAVCITGLAVTDISTNFTLFGQSVIMVLIQLGGLGIMTFTGFFGYFFSGGFSFKNQLMFGEILGEKKLNSVISTLLKIIFMTLLFEFIGGVFIYFTLDARTFETVGERIFFAAFHTISAFCNSGFSILQDGIRNDAYRYNYNFQLVLTFIFIWGGLGFGTILNIYTYFRTKTIAFVRQYILKKRHTYKAQAFRYNSKFILSCNIVVIVLATVSYFIMEQSYTLIPDRHSFGEWVTTFFMANSSRSAGFNSIDLNFLSTPTLIMVTTLMWMGASPGSTGGGVKVTTVAIALMNIVALARGKESIEFYKRRIAPESVHKAFAIIVLSILTIGLSFVLLNFSDPHQPMKKLLFETVSAYSTCGLSLGITPSLSPMGKMVIITTMFVGRVGMLTLLVAFIKNTKNKSYLYPTEKVLF